METKPLGVLLMMCGLPGSGKSVYAEKRNKINLSGESKIFSSDALRKEMFGDENEQGTPKEKEKLFVELHKRIKTWLSEGKIAIYDATNLNKRRRIAFLKEVNEICRYKECIFMAAPYEFCLENNKKRDRVVPEKVIKKMYMNFQPPHVSEGWDRIEVIFNEGIGAEDYISNVSNKLKVIENFDQCNQHHALTLDKHMIKTYEYLKGTCPDDSRLQVAGLFHDIGKPFTQTKFNSKGEDDGNCHYYQHHCVGAYDVFFQGYRKSKHYIISNESLLDISNLIFYHMHPYLSWKQSEKAKEKDRKLLGNEFFERVMKLHEADVAAH